MNEDGTHTIYKYLLYTTAVLVFPCLYYAYTLTSLRRAVGSLAFDDFNYVK